jgi:hypothetical protein
MMHLKDFGAHSFTQFWSVSPTGCKLGEGKGLFVLFSDISLVPGMVPEAWQVLKRGQMDG